MTELTLEQKLEFHYNPAPQRSPQWLEDKRGKIGASRLEDWLAVSKAKATMGKPLKARLDYEKELMFERQFGVSFNNYVNDAMQDGIDFENFAAQQFAANVGVDLAEVGCWSNAFMAVSPDRIVFPKGEGVVYVERAEEMAKALGVLEIKIVRDNTFTEILMSGVPSKHMKQVQAQLKATGLNNGWYIALNFTTKRFVIIDVARDEEFIDYMMEAIQEELVTEPFALDYVHEISGELPNSWSQPQMAAVSGAKVDHSDSNVSRGGW